MCVFFYTVSILVFLDDLRLRDYINWKERFRFSRPTKRISARCQWWKFVSCTCVFLLKVKNLRWRLHCVLDIFFFLLIWYSLVPSGKLTWQQKMDLLKMYSLLKMGIFHCYVGLRSLRKGTWVFFRASVSHQHVKSQTTPIETNEPRKKPSYFPFYWMVNRDPYNGLL